MKSDSFTKGRGAQKNSLNKFQKEFHLLEKSFQEYCRLEGEELSSKRTQYLPIFPKTIVNKVLSPDIPLDYSMNPYQGCEHGCIYCYARNTHEYYGYSAGLDFEQKILVKENAATLLEEKLTSKNWKAAPIILSGNTDCYQPAEKTYEITRACLEVFLKYKHPVGIITKNSLVLRDLDLLKELARYNLVSVVISVTSLSETTRRTLEPRTASISKRLKTISELSKENIPVSCMLAPIIPGINSHEIMKMAETVSKQGAINFGYSIVRLNGAIGELFKDWLGKTMPNKKEKVLSLIASCHGGSLKDNRFGIRQRGEGPIAVQINAIAKIAKQKYFKAAKTPKLNTELFNNYKDPQLSLFNRP